MNTSQKKQGLGFWFLAAAVVLTIVGAVLYYINANGSYYHDFNVTIVLMAVLALIVEICLLCVARVLGERPWMDILYPVIGIILAVTIVVFLSARVESAAMILGSDLEAGNQTAYNALAQAIAGMVCCLAAILLTGVAGFCRQIKD